MSWRSVFDPDLTSEYYVSIAALAVVDDGYIALGQEKTDPAFDSGTEDGAVWTSTDGADWVRAQSGDFGGNGWQQFYETIQTPFGVLVVGTDWASDNGMIVLWNESPTGNWERLKADSNAFSQQRTQWMNDIAVHGDTLVGVGWDTVSDTPMVWQGIAG